MKNLKSLGQTLSKNEQQTINGGGLRLLPGDLNRCTEHSQCQPEDGSHTITPRYCSDFGYCYNG